MSTAVPPPSLLPPRRRATRSAEGALLGGVAAGLAQHLRVPVLWMRIVFVIATVANGFGVLVYLGLWMWLPPQRALPSGAPGLDAATRQGRRSSQPRRLTDYGMLVALGAMAAGGLALVVGFTGGAYTTVPVLIGVTGLAVLWRQADDAQRERWSETGEAGPVRMVLGSGGWGASVRLLAGLALLVIAILAFTLRAGGWNAALNVAVAAVLGIVGIGFIAGPWLLRLSRDLADERSARAREQERADVAAHLHDSVLQTLAMIQRTAADPAAVTRLARAQERDLRSWLFGEVPAPGSTVAGALRQTAAQVEDDTDVPVELVVVGDAALSRSNQPLVHAAGEAMRNAAVHSGAAKVDVYLESREDGVEVFVRDRGRGFDPASVAPDRQGVRESILGRMRRHGGTAEVHSMIGAGTEVRLALPAVREGEGES